MTTKLRIKMGDVEVEYEGSDEFLRTELPELLRAVVALHAKATSDDQEGSENTQLSSDKTKGRRSLSVSTIATAIGIKSGSDLALAAGAALVLGEGKDSFSRSQLLKAMQSAKTYYKTTYRSNLTNYLSTLVKSQNFLDHGNDHFGLHDSKRQELEKKLA